MDAGGSKKAWGYEAEAISRCFARAKRAGLIGNGGPGAGESDKEAFAGGLAGRAIVGKAWRTGVRGSAWMARNRSASSSPGLRGRNGPAPETFGRPRCLKRLRACETIRIWSGEQKRRDPVVGSSGASLIAPAACRRGSMSAQLSRRCSSVSASMHSCFNAGGIPRRSSLRRSATRPRGPRMRPRFVRRLRRTRPLTLRCRLSRRLRRRSPRREATRLSARRIRSANSCAATLAATSPA